MKMLESRWTVDEATKLLKTLQDKVYEKGYSISLGGGLFSNNKQNEVSVYFHRAGAMATTDEMIEWLASLWPKVDVAFLNGRWKLQVYNYGGLYVVANVEMPQDVSDAEQGDQPAPGRRFPPAASGRRRVVAPPNVVRAEFDRFSAIYDREFQQADNEAAAGSGSEAETAADGGHLDVPLVYFDEPGTTAPALTNATYAGIVRSTESFWRASAPLTEGTSLWGTADDTRILTGGSSGGDENG